MPRGRPEAGSGLRLEVQGLVLLLTGAMTPRMLVEAGLLGSPHQGPIRKPCAPLMSGPLAESLDFF